MGDESTLLRDFAIIMAVAGAAIVLFRWLKQPPILGYLLAGILIGPFNLPSPPVHDVETIRLLADLGLVILLFGLGLEFGWQRIRQIGLAVVIIGAVEITFMVALGYQLGILMGWTGTEAIFLGAAMSISSSAILVKMLRESGRLFRVEGRLIVGILVVEDFAAVILLTVLSGLATTGAASFSEIVVLAGKLLLFTMAALVFGGLIAPRLITFVAQFRSSETLLIAGLALCFGLALVAEELGMSAAAGAFLIGAVVGDTDRAEEITHTMSPIRDMFAALFFVSIGMLVDFSQITDFIGPALVVSGVFIVGKIVADTLGTFFTGHDGKTSLTVGMGMPQIGEFSLAMVKVGVDHMAIGAFLYPVITVTTALTSLVYPFIYRSAGGTANFLERRSPRLLRQYAMNLTLWLTALRGSPRTRTQTTERIQHAVRIIILNMGIMVVVVAAGTFALQFVGNLAPLVQLRQSAVGLLIGFVVVALSIPSIIAIWRELQRLTDDLTTSLFSNPIIPTRLWRREDLRQLLRSSILAGIVVLVAIWFIPFASQLVSIGRFALPIPFLLIAAALVITAQLALKIHGALADTFNRTFLGQGQVPQSEQPGEDETGKVG